MEDFDGQVKTATYAAFAIGGEKDDYALNVLGKYNGTAGKFSEKYFQLARF